MSDVQLPRIRDALSGRYDIERELGRGGMATVCLAEDVKHGRKVAIKILKPELAAVLGADRFIHEIATTAQLQHPHILPLFDSGQVDGLLYYVMPYVQGDTLRDKLNAETQLAIAEAVRITTEIADALDYAHRHGVIHRDIKPENILLHDGRVLVADFGIALAVSAAAGGRMTETGLSLGTPHYMSPEQATADRTITFRSDIYSLGAVLYELLTGAPPHTASSAQQVIRKIVTEELAPVTELRRSVPPHVAAAVSKALEKLPADRFGSARAFAEALADPTFTAGAGPAGAATRRWVRDPRSVAAMAAALTATAALVASLARPGATNPVVYDVVLPDSVALAINFQPGFALAPRGEFIVYQAAQSDGGLWYRSLQDATLRPIEGTSRGQYPALSPDGTRVAFLRFSDPTRWTLDVVPLSGGAPTTLGSGTAYADVRWLADGRIRIVEADGNRVRWFDPGGGPTTERRIPYCLLPSDLPNTGALLCGGGASKWAYVRDSTAGDLPLWTGLRDSTLVYGSHFRVVDGRYLVYVSMAGDLVAAPVDLATRRVGRTVRLLAGIDRTGYVGAGLYQVSASGTLVYAEGPNRAVGNLVATDGRLVDTLDVERDAFLKFSVSPDGRSLAAVVAGLQGQELRLYNLRTGEHQVWVRHPTIEQPVWSRRSDRIVFSWSDSVFIGDPDQAHPPALVATAPGGRAFEAFDWTAGDRIVGGDWDGFVALSLNPAAQPAAWDTLATEASFPVMSPDGRWLAYCDPSLNTVWLAPMPPTSRRYQVAAGSLEGPRWRSSRDIVFQYYDGASVSVRQVGIGASGLPPEFARSKWMDLPGLIETPGQSFALMPDGRVLYLRGVSREPVRSLRVVPRWVDRMRRAVDDANR